MTEKKKRPYKHLEDPAPIPPQDFVHVQRRLDYANIYRKRQAAEAVRRLGHGNPLGILGLLPGMQPKKKKK